MWCQLSIILYLLSCLAFIGVFLAIFLICRSPRELPRRLFQHFKPVRFLGTPPDYHVSQIIESPARVQNPQILCTVVLFGITSKPEWKSRYFDGLTRFLRKKHRLWPEAQVRLYVTESVLPVVRDTMLSHGVDLHVVVPEPLGFEGTMWRFWAFDDSLIPVLSCDADDDLLSQNFVTSLKTWLASDRLFYVRSQYLTRVTVQKINACRFACKPGAFRKILGPGGPSVRELIRPYLHLHDFGCDEALCNAVFWPIVRQSVYMTPPIWTEYNWIWFGAALSAAILVNVFLVFQGIARVREKYDKPKLVCARSVITRIPQDDFERVSSSASSSVSPSSTIGADLVD